MAVARRPVVGGSINYQVRPRYLQHELETASDQQVPVIVRKLCARGAKACNVSSRRSVHRRGRGNAGPLDASRRVGSLGIARPSRPAPSCWRWPSAVRQRRTLDDDGRNTAADIALRILLWPLPEGQIDRPRLVTACDHVLRAKATAVEIEEASPSRGPQIATLLEQPHLSGPRAMPPGELPLPPLPNEVTVYEGGEEPARAQPIRQLPTRKTGRAGGRWTRAPVQPARAVVEDFSALDGFELFHRWHHGDSVVRGPSTKNYAIVAISRGKSRLLVI